MKLSEHFDSREFNCRCGHCSGGGDVVEPELILALEQLREQLQQPIHVVSGFRCALHPETKRRPGSYHPTGQAADITVNGVPVTKLFLLAAGIPEFNKGGIGIYPSDARPFIHVDVRKYKARWGQIDGVYCSFITAWEWAKQQENVA